MDEASKPRQKRGPKRSRVQAERDRTTVLRLWAQGKREWEIAEYLEERAAMWYKSLSAPQEGASVTKGKPTQGVAGRKSLSPQGSSERRSLGTSLADLDGDERREAAMEAVRSALHATGSKR